MNPDKPELKVTVFTDYICPFCYIGDARLQRLRERYDLRVNWCFLEIHPETPAEGQPVSALNYPPQQWRQMMSALADMAREEGLEIREHDFTTSSRSAMQLAEAVKFVDPVVFYRLHAALFEAFFVRGLNIGDRTLLRGLATEAGFSEQQVEAAWRDPGVEKRLAHQRRAAQELGVRATPTFFVGEQRLDGVVPTEQLFSAARAAVG